MVSAPSVLCVVCVLLVWSLVHHRAVGINYWSTEVVCFISVYLCSLLLLDLYVFYTIHFWHDRDAGSKMLRCEAIIKDKEKWACGCRTPRRGPVSPLQEGPGISLNLRYMVALCTLHLCLYTLLEVSLVPRPAHHFQLHEGCGGPGIFSHIRDVDLERT